MSRLTACLISILLCGSCGFDTSVPKEPKTVAMPDDVVVAFEKQCRRLLAEQPGGVPGSFIARDGWVLEGNELRYGQSGAFFGKWAPKVYPEAEPGEADPFAAMLHFRDELSSRGIELVFMPIPVRPVIYPESVLELDRYDGAVPYPHVKPMQDRFMKLVRKKSIGRINLTPFFLVNRDHSQGPLFCKSDTHWTPVGAFLAAQLAAEHIKSRKWFAEIAAHRAESPNPFTAEWLTMEHLGHMYVKLRKAGQLGNLEPETLNYRRISGPGMEIAGEEDLRHPNSPVILVGDSNLLWWWRNAAGFPHQLAYELGFHVDSIITRGGGVNQARLSFVREVRSDPGTLEGTKTVLWVFSIRAVLGAQPSWVKTPIEPKSSAPRR
jgi:alginate O-acetyltransferase complex protein AlgJ